MNTTTLPRRSGVSDAPYVFQARGRVRLLPPSPPLLPRPVFSIPIRKLLFPSKVAKHQRRRASSNASALSSCEVIKSQQDDSDDEEHEEHVPPSSILFQEHSDVHPEADVESDEGTDDEEEGIEEEEEDFNATIPASKYNVPNAFATYLKTVHQHNRRWKFTQSDTSDSDDDHASPASPPGLIYGSSSSPVSSSPIASSPASVTSMFSLEPYHASVISSLSKAAPTPAPLHPPWQRLRLERVQKRMDNLKKQEWMCTKDESESEELDELSENSKGSKTQGDKKAATDEMWVKPILKPGEVWDPFGDEVEI